ncbi:MAG TPA: hypothetical protein VMJ30_05000 [Gemmatimonadales bacterium]|nr:hypothetical protein [Gemmatimonadales bacterium]
MSYALWAGAALWLAGVGCAERERLTFPPVKDTRPTSRITVPSTDVAVTAGPQLTMIAIFDAPLGLDTIYTETDAGSPRFPPLVGAQSPATIGYPFSTAGRAGDTLVLKVFATDVTGQRSDTAIRLVVLQ